MNMHTRVRMEKVRSAEGGKKIWRMSSEKRVTMVTMVMRMEKKRPSKNSRTF